VTDWNAVLVGTVLEIGLLVTGAGVPIFGEIAWLGTIALLSIGLFGGIGAGGLVDGPRRARAYHGLLSGFSGGLVFAGWLWYTMTANVYLGGFYSVASLIATSGIPPDVATQYDSLLPVAFGGAGIVLFALEGAIAGGMVPRGVVSPPPIHSERK
jgi:hypothetical protein